MMYDDLVTDTYSRPFLFHGVRQALYYALCVGEHQVGCPVDGYQDGSCHRGDCLFIGITVIVTI